MNVTTVFVEGSFCILNVMYQGKEENIKGGGVGGGGQNELKGVVVSAPSGLFLNEPLRV